MSQLYNQRTINAVNGNIMAWLAQQDIERQQRFDILQMPNDDIVKTATPSSGNDTIRCQTLGSKKPALITGYAPTVKMILWSQKN